MKKSISVVIPNYNGEHLLAKNLPSLFNAIKEFDYEIIIVDDCSNDGSISFLQNRYPEVTIIKNKTNLGFSGTCNKGIFAAKLDLVCIVNTDVTFSDDYFKTAITALNETNVFAIKGDIINYGKDFQDIINTEKSSRVYYKHGFLRLNRDINSTEVTSYLKDNPTFVLLGCCFLCKREILLELGGYNEIYSPFYWEDSDIALRAISLGYKLIYLPEARVFHQMGSTISNHRSNTKRQLVSFRNKFFFTWQHLERKDILLTHIPITLFNLLTRWVILDWKYYAALAMALHSASKHTPQKGS